MFSYFLGGALLSGATAVLYSSGGWGGVCALGAATSAVGLAFWLIAEVRNRDVQRRELGFGSDGRLGRRAQPETDP